MEMTNSRTIAAPPSAVWEGLNDPETLKACLPGCESFERIDDSTFKAALSAKIGPVSAKFGGTMRIMQSTPPMGYTLRFEGQGGAAGFANGEALVTLSPVEPHSTLLAYNVKAQVGGKLAQIGSRLIDGAAAKLADDFFARFSERLAPAAAEAAMVPVAGGRAPESRAWIRYLSLGLILAIIVYLSVRGFR
jgi:carbon monoxide dehydrogenase subunit G